MFPLQTFVFCFQYLNCVCSFVSVAGIAAEVAVPRRTRPTTPRTQIRTQTPNRTRTLDRTGGATAATDAAPSRSATLATAIAATTDEAIATAATPTWTYPIPKIHMACLSTPMVHTHTDRCTTDRQTRGAEVRRTAVAVVSRAAAADRRFADAVASAVVADVAEAVDPPADRSLAVRGRATRRSPLCSRDTRSHHRRRHQSVADLRINNRRRRTANNRLSITRRRRRTRMAAVIFTGLRARNFPHNSSSNTKATFPTPTHTRVHTRMYINTAPLLPMRSTTEDLPKTPLSRRRVRTYTRRDNKCRPPKWDNTSNSNSSRAKVRDNMCRIRVRTYTRSGSSNNMPISNSSSNRAMYSMDNFKAVPTALLFPRRGDRTTRRYMRCKVRVSAWRCAVLMSHQDDGHLHHQGGSHGDVPRVLRCIFVVCLSLLRAVRPCEPHGWTTYSYGSRS